MTLSLKTAEQSVKTIATKVFVPVVQPKLTINEPKDVYEQEADDVAERVMRTRTPSVAYPLIPLTISNLQRKESGTANGFMTAPPLVSDVISSQGQSLDKDTQEFMGNRIGHDFSPVRIHTDSKAAESAQSINAKAYASGNHIVFGKGEYQPHTEGGKRLLAHELVHTVQQGIGVIRRVCNPNTTNCPEASAPNQSSASITMTDGSKQFFVRTVKDSEFEAMTGIKTSSMPEKKLLSPAEAGINSDSNAGGMAGASLSMLLTPRPTLPLSLGTTGVLWSSNAHLSQFAVVPQENPLSGFFFGDTSLKTYGFRANQALHIASTLERNPLLFRKNGGWLATDKLNIGASGNYVNDAVFPYLPNSVAVHTQGGADKVQGAQDLAECMTKAADSDELKSTYTFSPPKKGTPAYERYKRGWKEGKPPPTANCLGVAEKFTQKAIGSGLVFDRDGKLVNLSTATFVETGEPVPGMLPSAAKNMKPYLAQWDRNPSMQGLSKTTITSGMWMNGLTGVIRIGGVFLLLYSVSKTANRYEQAPASEKPFVIGEEATMFTIGLVGSVIGEAIGEVVLCTGTGPGVGLCMIVMGGIGAGIATGSTHDTVQSISSTLQSAAEMNRQGTLLPNIMEVTTQILGSEEQKKVFNTMKKTERSNPNNGLFDIFSF